MEVNGKDDITESQMCEYDCIHLWCLWMCDTHLMTFKIFMRISKYWNWGRQGWGQVCFCRSRPL